MVFPNLEGMKQLKGMTDSDMASVIGVSRQTFLTKNIKKDAISCVIFGSVN